MSFFQKKISQSVIVGRREKNQASNMTNQGVRDNEYAAYTLSNDSIIDVLSSLQMCIELVPER